MSIGDKIRQARINNGLTQKELANELKKLGEPCKNNTICSWETNASNPNPDTINALCKILKVDANYLLGFSNKETKYTDFEILINKNKDILTDGDIEIIKTIIEVRKKEVTQKKK